MSPAKELGAGISEREGSRVGVVLLNEVRVFTVRIPLRPNWCAEDVMFKWHLLVEDGRKAGHTFSQADLIIAATAAHHGLTIVSRNAAEYERARVPLLNPWQPLPP
jgi:predicted nucleic acid-binding protein